jgi:hypothetical protein
MHVCHYEIGSRLSATAYRGGRRIERLKTGAAKSNRLAMPNARRVFRRLD